MSDYINEIRFDTKRAEKFFAKKLAFTLGPIELKDMIAKMKNGGLKIVDTRFKEDYEASHLEGAISMPKSEVESKLSTLSKNDIHVVYCYNQQCHLAASVALMLAKNDYPVMELDGGFKVWSEDFGLEVVQ